MSDFDDYYGSDDERVYKPSYQTLLSIAFQKSQRRHGLVDMHTLIRDDLEFQGEVAELNASYCEFYSEPYDMFKVQPNVRFNVQPQTLPRVAHRSKILFKSPKSPKSPKSHKSHKSRSQKTKIFSLV